ncbi:MAG: glycoside hydrolase family protein [Cyanobacteriota bacterium]|nr:glycoside hydrolase family protein [Cyanobacteriota bacterium]
MNISEKGISEKGIALIKKWEGCELRAYLDVVGVPTIGFGSITYLDGRAVHLGDQITQEQAEALLIRECQLKCQSISRLIAVAVSQNEFDALASLVYNIGEGAFATSTLLCKLNASDHQGAAEQFLVWNKGTINGVKVEIEGLTNRRREEKKLFESEAVSGEVISHDPSPQEQVTWLEAFNDQGKTVLVAWQGSEAKEILELGSASKKLMMEAIMQYPNASNLLIAAPGKSLPTGERIKVRQRCSQGVATDPGGTPPAPAEILSRGSVGAEVEVMQRRLQELGYYNGPIDADFGSGTDAAVRRFQADVFGLAEADGRVGSITWKALWSSAAADPTDTPPLPAAPGKTYLRLTKTNKRDQFGLNVLILEYIKDGSCVGSLEVCSGAPGCQAFRTGAESQAGSFEPLPEGLWQIENIAWCDGRDNYTGNTFSSGLGPVSTPLVYRAPGSTRRASIEIHIDWNRQGAPGTAGCIGIYSIGDYKKLVTWLRDTDPRDLFVDWGKGTCPKP